MVLHEYVTLVVKDNNVQLKQGYTYSRLCFHVNIFTPGFRDRHRVANLHAVSRPDVVDRDADARRVAVDHREGAEM